MSASSIGLRLAVLASATLLLLRLSHAAVEAVDDTGERIRLPQPARRVISLSPHLTELLFEAGAGDRVVGAAAYSDFPAAAVSIPRIGDARALDLERIVMSRPDLIVAWASGSPKAQVARLRSLGYPVFSNEPRKLDDVATAIERLGTLAGTGTTARVRAAVFRARLAELRGSSAGKPPVRVFYQVWGHPLLTVNADHVIADALRTCGAENVFGSYRLQVSQPSRESVMLADPDAIVVAAAPTAEREAVEPWQRWHRLRAVATGNLFAVDPDVLHRQTSRILDGVAKLCAHLDRARTR